nr:unnamed protein product [Digitaria exilis]CAB3504708.1 unnamed protein product [Digitaria exilis]
MPSRGFFFPYDGSSYDPYAHNRAAPSYGHLPSSYPRQPTTACGHHLYSDPYCPAASRAAMGSHCTGDSFSPADACWDAKLAEVVQMLRAAANRKPPRPRPLSIPINIRGLDAAAEPETEPADRTTEVLTPAVALVAAEKQKGGPSVEEEEAAAARGFLARRSVRAVRRVEWETAAVGRIVAEKAAALRENGRARLAAGEVLMKMLLRLDGVRGAREYRRQVTRRLLALQDAVDALDPMAAPPSPEAGAHEAEPEAEVNEERETSPGDTVLDVCEPQDSDAEGEWEMVAEESADAPPRQEPPEQEVTTAAEAGAPGGVDTAGLAEMVAALCEQSAQQSAVISALTQRVDVLERAVRQTEKEVER